MVPMSLVFNVMAWAQPRVLSTGSIQITNLGLGL